MTLNIEIPKIRKAILLMMGIMALLTACAPAEATASEPSPTSVATSPSSPTITVTSPPTSTATPFQTPTATLDPEEATEAAQAAIRAEVLSYGIDLDNLANSDNEYISSNPSVELWQGELNHSFDSTEVDSEIMVVLDIEQLRSEAEYNRAVTTDGGWKFLDWAKVAYKTHDNLWATANLPLEAYNESTETIWMKYPEVTKPWLWEDWELYAILNGFSSSKPDALIAKKRDYYERVGYRLDTGAIFKLYTEYPDPNSSLGDGEVGEMPRYSVEQLELFRRTGDASIFEYRAADGTYFIWPFYSYFSVSPSNN